MITTRRAKQLFAKAVREVMNGPNLSKSALEAAQSRRVRRLIAQRPEGKKGDRMLGDWTLEARSRYLGINDFSKDK